MRRYILLPIIITAALAAGTYIIGNQRSAHTTHIQSASTPTTPQTSSVITTPDPQTHHVNKQLFSHDDPASLWVVINKQRPIQPADYQANDLRLPDVSLRIPGSEQMQLRQEAATAAETMFSAAKKQNINLQVTTAYRGYNYQKTLYNGYVASKGQSVADTMSARPGFSEHQTGLALDIRSATSPNQCYLEICFADMSEGIWLADHAHEYGFILRYPNNKASITGYQFEPWHYRYVGTELAKEIHDQNNITLEEFFELGAARDYQ